MMIKLKLFAAYLLLVISASPALADIQFAIGEPAEGSINTGIGQIPDWTVSDDVIVPVEALLDGVSLGLVPYGGSRQDVANVFPDLPNSEFSGWETPLIRGEYNELP